MYDTEKDGQRAPTCGVLKGLCDTERDRQREVGLECVVATLCVASMDAAQGVMWGGGLETVLVHLFKTVQDDRELRGVCAKNGEKELVNITKHW